MIYFANDEAWEQYILDFEKVYTSEEEKQARYKIKI